MVVPQIPDHLSRVDLNDISQPHMDSGQSTVSRGVVFREDINDFTVVG